MKKVLSDEALRELKKQGFVRTGIHLPAPMVAMLRELYDGMSPASSNWSYFMLMTLSHYSEGGLKGLMSRLFMKWKARSMHRRVRATMHEKSIYGSSEALPSVLHECLAQGLAAHLGEIALLVGHDIYLESDRNKKMFGYHEDSFGWEIFYQTEDDLTLYIPLRELSENSGGRLIVDRHPDRNDVDGNRSEWIVRFAEFCRRHDAIDHRGFVTRESVQRSPNRRVIAKEFNKLLHQRSATDSRPEPDEMVPINSAEGEVVLFNNKRFHNAEPWKLDVRRAIYIIRCFPLYDLGLAPPSTFLNKVACNRFMIDGCRGTLTPMDCESDLPQFVSIPS